MLLENAIGKSVTEILEINKDNVLEMLGIELGPVRLKCALLGWDVLQQALQNKNTK
jgi:nitrogen fixation NifU-like protein